MGIRELNVSNDGFYPGEYLNNQDSFVHITVSYDISGYRDKIDRQIEKAIDNNFHLQKIDSVNTLLYWQENILFDLSEENNNKLKSMLKEKLNEIFVDKSNLSNETVTVFCMVGNARAFAFEIDA